LLPFEKIPVFLKWITALIRVKLIGQLEIMLRIDLDGNGDIGNKKEVTQVEQPAQMSLNIRPVIGGFSVNKKSDTGEEIKATKTPNNDYSHNSKQ
jgi:hypothetical protein